MGELEQAIADFNRGLEAWRPRATYPDAIFEARANALLRNGQFEKAIDDFEKVIGDSDTVIELERDHAPAYANRGIAKVLAGVPGAEEDLAAAVHMVPSNPYWVIWLHVARLGAGKDDRDELAANAARLDRSRWPWPAVQMLLDGGSPPGAFETPAEGGLGSARACETSFYAGMMALKKRGALGQAKEHLQAAAGACRPDKIEAAAAKVELKRIP
jgi:lipoprotein NlpI